MFLLPLILTREDTQKLLTDPNGKSWREPELEEKLKERLSTEKYEIYLETIDELQQAMEELGKKLGVSNDRFQRRLEEAKESDPTNAAAKIPEKDLLNGEAFWSDLVYQTQRIKISLGETARNELVERVEKLNSQLRNILKVSDEITTAERSAAARKNSSLPKAMLSFWRNADKVYALLKTAWQCTCVSMHSAHLLLENRTYQKIDLSIALMYGTGVLEGATPSWAWHDTVIVMADKQALPSLNTSTVAPPTLPHPTGPKGWSSHPLRSAMRRSGGKQKSVKLAPVRYVQKSLTVRDLNMQYSKQLLVN